MIHHEAELVKAPDFIPGVAALYPPNPPIPGALTYLLGGECGRAAVTPIVMAIGPVVDSITPTICLERLARRWEFSAQGQLHCTSPYCPSHPHPNIICETQEILWKSTQGEGHNCPNILKKLKSLKIRPLGLRNCQISPVAPAPGLLWGPERFI